MSEWWKKAVVYQVYPRSFMDSNGDGIGDLKGILQKLDYIHKLGVDVIWLNPIFDSPNDDNGYDIRDYYSIMHEFGTMDDFDALLEQAHTSGIKIMMDLVVNHTSDEHAWFVASKSSEDNPYRDYYYWRKEPNNWVSIFSGSAWQHDEATDAYFLHLFSKKQPDLNWENPQVREEVYRLMTFWLEKGIDGFRMDVINFISKNPTLPSVYTEPGQLYAYGGEHFMNGPRIHEFLQEMHERVLSKFDMMTVGEMPGVDPDLAVLYTGQDRHELQMVFQFEHMDLDSGWGGKWDYKPWRLSDLKAVISKWQEGLYQRGWNSLYLNNHDQPRMVSRFGHDGKYRVTSAKMLATFLHMLQGTPYIYYGEEIGMTNVAFSSIEDYRDVEIHNMWKERVLEGGADPAVVLDQIHVKGRDNARTPMQWTDGEQAGFTTGTPWIGVNPNHGEINVEKALQDPDSIFYYYQRLIALRKTMPIITEGKYVLLWPDHDQIYAYLREGEQDDLLVVCNFYGNTLEFYWPDGYSKDNTTCLIANYTGEQWLESGFVLRPYESRVYHRLRSQ